MARETYLFFIVLSIFTTLFGLVFAYYCEWDLCGPDQYCCGDNLCCNNVYSLWYFWAGIIILVIMLSSCGGGFLRYCFAVRNQIIVKPVTKYMPLPNEPSTSDDAQQFHLCEDSDENLCDVTLASQISRDVIYGNKDQSVSFPCAPRGPPPPYSKTPDTLGSIKKDTSWS